MTALFAGLTTVDVLHGLDHTPDPHLKVTSTDFLLAAGGPATNAAVTYAALEAAREKFTTQRQENGDVNAPSALLLSALGSGALAHVLAEDLGRNGVRVLDATEQTISSAPAISSIIDHATGRMVASTNARVALDISQARAALSSLNSEDIDALLVDGHNPELADLALRVGTSHFPTEPSSTRSERSDRDPFAELEEKPSHPRILDGGSWKPWLTPLLGFIDIAVVSADFIPPLVSQENPEGIVDFLRGFGIQRIIRTQGPESVQWWWDELHGTVDVPAVQAFSTLGAGDIFHGAFTWAAGACQRSDGLPEDPTELITFASRIASTSVTYFGTRSWIQDEAIAQAMSEFLQSRGA